MRILLKLFVCISLVGGLLPTSTIAKVKSNQIQCFKHNVQLQLADSQGFPVDGTEFWVTLEIIKQDNLVTIQFPVINFQTGQVSAENPSYPTTPIPGGYLSTASGFLPVGVRPADLVYRSIIAASNNGQSLPFSFAQPVDTLPVPPDGYIVSITSDGALVVQCAGTFGNIIPPGPQILMPCSITYIVKPSVSLCTNYIIDPGFTNTTQFSDPSAADSGFRDSHVNDAYNGTVAFSWTSNANIADKTNGTLNAFVAVGKINSNGTLSMGAPVQLTNLPPNVQAWDTAVAINRTNKNNIVVSYGILDYTVGANPSCRAVSFDGGKTWPAPLEYTYVVGSITGTTLTVIEVLYGSLAVGDVITTVESLSPIVPGTTITAFGPDTTGGVGTYTVSVSQSVPEAGIHASSPLNGMIPIQNSLSLGGGDQRGVSSDKFGNIWYSTTNLEMFNGSEFMLINQPLFAASSDGGVTFSTVYTVPLPDPTEFPLGTFYFDFPQYCFGGDGLGNYGLWFQTTFYNLLTGDGWPTVGFIPIFDLGSWATETSDPTFTYSWLQSFTNAFGEADLTASSNGKVWFQGILAPSIENSGEQSNINLIQPLLTLFKSPGTITENYAGPWDYANWNTVQFNTNPPLDPDLDWAVISQPYLGYFSGPQSIIYDEGRQALYAIQAIRSPDFSQNMRIFLIISCNNGQTWSDPIDIATTDFANRGFPSMALDPVTRNLVFGWYDGCNDPSYESVQYMGAILPAAQLDALVNRIPLSNPQYQIPAATGAIG